MGHDHTHSHGHDHSHDHGQAGHGKHATVKLYWIFCVILCAITFAEFLLFKEKDALGMSNTVMAVLMLIMSIVKFTMVVGWYMHLRFDHNWVKLIFIVSLAMGGATGLALTILM